MKKKRVSLFSVTDVRWVFYWAWKNLFPSRRRVMFFSAMASIGVTLGVAVLVIVQNVMNVFQSDIRKKLVETQGEVRVESRGVTDFASCYGNHYWRILRRLQLWRLTRRR